MTLTGACADDVLMDAGNMHGGILFHDTRRSVDWGIRHCEHNARYSQLSTHEAERELRQDNEVTFRQTRTVDQLADLMTKTLARDQHRSLTELLIGYRRGLWFNLVTSNNAKYEGNNRDGDSDDSMPDPSVPEDSDTEDDDDLPDLDLVPFEDEAVAAAA